LPAPPAQEAPRPAESARTVEETPAAAPSRLRGVLTEMFGIDLRSLALFRITVALLLLTDLLCRCWDIEAFYTDFGVVPRDRLAMAQDFGHFFTLHAVSGGVAGQAVFFLVAAVFAIMLLVGWKTRLAAVASWLLLISLHNRNPIVIQGGDVLLRAMLFWALFLPLGAARPSLDARRSMKREPGPVLSVGSAAALLQLAYMYWFSVALKSHPSWHREGTAVWTALHLDAFATPLGAWMGRALPFWLLRLMTHVTVATELCGPVLALLPLGADRLGPQVRTAAAFAMMGFHLVGLGGALRLGLFPYVCAIAWTLFLPPWFWDVLVPRLWARLPLPGPARRGVEAAWGRLNRRPDAAAGVALHRAARPWAGRAWQAVAALFFVYMTLWNLRGVNPKVFGPLLSQKANFVGEWVHLDQFWGMFAPKPMMDDGWFVFAGTLKDGETVDLYKVIRDRRERDGLGPIDYAKPAHPADTYRDERWRKYLVNLWDKNNSIKRPWLADYLRRWWDRSHPDSDRQLAALDLVYMEEDTPERPGMPAAPVHKVYLWRAQWAPVPRPRSSNADEKVNAGPSGAVISSGTPNTANPAAGAPPDGAARKEP
jgi:hypothetical protein